ncbi:MAG: IPT/TIG domain-containing protein [Spirosomataceae bacterium]
MRMKFWGGLFLLTLGFYGCKKDTPVTESPVQIANFFPASEGPGAEVKIYGIGFGSTASAVTVLFNTTSATITSVTDTLIKAQVPQGATSGSITVKVGTNQGVSSTAFTVLLGTWVQKQDVPVTPGFMGAVGFSIGTKGFIGGGGSSSTSGFTSNFWQYDTQTAQWSSRLNYPKDGFYGGTAFVIGDVAYVGIGKDNTGNFSNEFYKFNPTANTWTRLSNFPGSAKNTASATTALGKGYVFINKEVWEYDPTTDKWTQKGDFPGTTRFETTAQTINNEIYFGLGVFPNLKDWWKYEPTTDKWTQKATFPADYTTGLASFVIDNKVFVMGGYSEKCWSYNPTTDAWTQRTSNSVQRGYPAAFAIGSKGYLGTGSVGATTLKNDFWEFNPN